MDRYYWRYIVDAGCFHTVKRKVGGMFGVRCVLKVFLDMFTDEILTNFCTVKNFVIFIAPS